MDEREVICCKCETTATARRDDIMSGWVIDDPNWAFVNYSHYCPKCNAKRMRNEGIINERKRMYPTIDEGEE